MLANSFQLDMCIRLFHVLAALLLFLKIYSTVSTKYPHVGPLEGILDLTLLGMVCVGTVSSKEERHAYDFLDMALPHPVRLDEVEAVDVEAKLHVSSLLQSSEHGPKCIAENSTRLVSWKGD